MKSIKNQIKIYTHSQGPTWNAKGWPLQYNLTFNIYIYVYVYIVFINPNTAIMLE